ncbi:MAG: Flp pilus assembly complex ATPase component TadA, partial [Myxococcales bacterium]|nr:Flp pilus assembly complex ATPase component TadA [Myxococcales bacterium]
MPKRLGEQLLRAGLINEDQLRRAAQEQKISGGLIGSNLIRLGFLKEQQLLDFLASHYGFPAVDLTTIEIEPETLALVPRDVCTKHQVIPISRAGSTLVIAMADPLNMFAIDDVKFLTGYNIDVVVAGEDAIRTALEGHFGDPTEREMASLEDVMSGIEAEDFEVVDTDEDVDIAALERETSEAPVVKLVNVILTEAIRRGASDIHIEPYEKSFRVRYRLDGVLHKIMDPPLKLRNGIISRLKIMSELDIAERRLPQDGRIKLKMGRGREMDFRVSVIPTLFGEKTVLRLLDKSNLQLDMTKLGFDPEPLTHFQDAIHQPYGMVLVTGPTGSGKTTTLYSALSELNKEGENISTAEDPVEFNLAGINQVQMHESIGLNFASALRSFLRQDPDIIMV